MPAIAPTPLKPARIQWKPHIRHRGQLGYIKTARGIRVLAVVRDSNERKATLAPASTPPRHFTLHPTPWKAELMFPVRLGGKKIAAFDTETEAKAWAVEQLGGLIADLLAD
jgi:hypothetical protein